MPESPAPESRTQMTLPPEAYEELPEGASFPSVVPASQSPREFTAKAALIGILVGIVFGTANAYLGLKVGLTVSASIPAAVIGVAVFGVLRRGTILETNIVQTIGSAGESLAAGVIFTLPVLFLWGLAPGFWPIFPLALLGGLLGVLFMIPLRRYLIVREHGRLTYPEGTACAEVLVASQAGGSQARQLFAGMGVGALYMAATKFLRLWPEEPDVQIHGSGYRTSFGGSLSPELLGVGFIIGPRIAAVMLAGGVVGWGVLIPLIYLFGDSVNAPVAPETTALIRDMGPFEIWSRYLRYIGAGGVAFGGLFTLVKSSPVIVRSFRMAVQNLRSRGSGEVHVPRTERDLPITWVAAAAGAMALLAAFLPLKVLGGHIGIVAGVCVVVFGFFFVTVSSRIVGLLGSSSNPISGMTIATVLVCALLFGGTAIGLDAKITVLTIGSLVCIAAAIAGDTSQDLKTGHLVGATPRKQQIGEVIGVVTAALAMSTVLTLFRDGIVSGAFKAPQANLIRLVIDGVLEGSLPWGLVFTGMFLAFCVEIMGLPTLAFAVGLYLPVHLAVPIIAGGLIRLVVEKRFSGEDRAERRERGVLYSSGLIAGGALVGVLAAGFAFKEFVPFPGLHEPAPHVWHWATAAFLGMAATLAVPVLRSSRKGG
ncbi:MAG: oligopeptide transporter, OPT family [Gemmatimonadota bacterium]|jgi:putative OPT family oligopeptide transporter|nr:oligopeptide transporter, OPT family [Gemmatimonadota bacterium]MDP6802386.1 oligopeptide transporter, OPT family [Gemmatimonadota bacterium]